jgi:hypothetical protein
VPGIGGDAWSHLKPPGWRRWMAEETGVVRCALAWKEIVSLALADLENVPHHTVRYEDLVADPERTSRDLCAFLGVSWDPAAGEFCRKVQNRPAGSYQAAHQVMWAREGHSVRVGRWRERARENPAEMARVERIVEDLLPRLGYR